MRTIKVLVCLLTGAALPFLAAAQPSASSATQQQENLQRTADQQQIMASLKAGTNAPEIYEGESSDVGPQHILRTVPRRTHFEVKADSQFLYTDNALLTSPRSPSTIWVNTISAAYTPPAYRVGEGRLSPTIGVASQWYNYGIGEGDTIQGINVHDLNFDVQSAFVGAKYLLPSDWSFFGEFDYSRFVTEHNYYEFYHDFSPMIGVQRLFKLRDNLVLAGSLKGDYHDTWKAYQPLSPYHNSEDRFDGTATISLYYQVVPKLVVQPYYQYQYSRYQHRVLFPTQTRNDRLNSLGVSAAYYFTPNVAVRTFVNYNDKESSDSPTLAYHEYNVGVNLSGTFRF